MVLSVESFSVYENKESLDGEWTLWELISEIEENHLELKTILEEKWIDFHNSLWLFRVIFWKDFFDFVFKWWTLQVEWEVYNNSWIDANSIAEMLEEIINLEKSKGRWVFDTVIITLDELKQLEEILAWWSVSKSFSEFMEYQINENISSVSVVKDTTYMNKLEETLWSSRDAELFQMNLDNVWRKLIGWILPDWFSEDSIFNLSTWVTFLIMNLSDWLDEWWIEDVVKEISAMYSSTDPYSKSNIERLFKVLFSWENKFMEYSENLFDLFTLIWDYTKEKWIDPEKNEILMNPYSFYEVAQKFTKWEIDEGAVISILDEKWQSYVPRNLNSDEVWEIFSLSNRFWENITVTNALVWQVNQISESLNLFKWSLGDYVVRNSEWLFALRDVTKEIGIWERFKWFVDKILKLLWWDWWFEEFEYKYWADVKKIKGFVELCSKVYINWNNENSDIENNLIWSIVSDIKTNNSNFKDSVEEFNVSDFKDGLETLFKNNWDNDILTVWYWKYWLTMWMIELSGIDVFVEWSNSEIDLDKLLEKEDEIINKIISSEIIKISWDDNYSNNIKTDRELAKALYNNYFTYHRNEKDQTSSDQTEEQWSNTDLDSLLKDWAELTIQWDILSEEEKKQLLTEVSKRLWYEFTTGQLSKIYKLMEAIANHWEMSWDRYHLLWVIIESDKSDRTWWRAIWRYQIMHWPDHSNWENFSMAAFNSVLDPRIPKNQDAVAYSMIISTKWRQLIELAEWSEITEEDKPILSDAWESWLWKWVDVVTWLSSEDYASRVMDWLNIW